jgi:hypothetical protein
MNIYDGFYLGNTFGIVFQLFSICVNMIVMFNLVIAILSEVYARLAPLELGLYYDNLISSLPAMKYNKEYGYMILLPPPFNLLYVPFMPLWVIQLSDEKQKKLN